MTVNKKMTRQLYTLITKNTRYTLGSTIILLENRF